MLPGEPSGSAEPIRLTNAVANWILRKLGVEPAEELRSARSAQELVSLVRTSARSGSLDPATAALLDRSLQFGELTAEELMIIVERGGEQGDGKPHGSRSVH